MNKSFISNNIRTSSAFRLFLALIIVANLMPVFSLHAQSPAPTNGASADYTVLAPLPCIEGNGITCPAGNGNLATKVSFKTYIQYAFNLLIALAAVAAVLMIVVGGFEYMTSVSVDGKSGGIKRVQNALIGLLLVLSSYLILRTVDPRLVEIPTTLVPQITLRPELIAEVTLQSQLEDEANKFKIDFANDLESIKAADKEIADLRQKRQSLEYQILALAGSEATGNASESALIACQNIPVDNVEMTEACVQLYNINNQVSRKISEQEFLFGKRSIESIVSLCDPIKGPSCYDENIAKISTIYETNYRSQLQPDQVSKMAEYVLYSQNYLNIGKQQALVYKKIDDMGAVYGTALYVAGKIIGKDSETYKKIYAQKEASITEINAIVDRFKIKSSRDASLIKQLEAKRDATIKVIRAMNF